MPYGIRALVLEPARQSHWHLRTPTRRYPWTLASQNKQNKLGSSQLVRTHQSRRQLHTPNISETIQGGGHTHYGRLTFVLPRCDLSPSDE